MIAPITSHMLRHTINDVKFPTAPDEISHEESRKRGHLD
jgi:hypothetical protein